MSLVRVQNEPLSLDECHAAVSGSDKGGICLFVGTVRDHNQGLKVHGLEYEAYTSMAEREMKAIVAEIEAELPGTVLACLHRVGALGLGDLAVICAAGAPHRGDAFAACRALIDRIKARVPIWKREHGPDGPYWVDWQDARAPTG
jgi:molybdopterin synthase catalytic subunit